LARHQRQKNDMADAEAICEAVSRATMRFVPTKTPEQQSCLMLHRARHLFIRQQTAVINSIRAYLAEFGIVAPVERKGVAELLHVVADPSDKRTSWRRPLFTESKAGCAAINAPMRGNSSIRDFSLALDAIHSAKVLIVSSLPVCYLLRCKQSLAKKPVNGQAALKDSKRKKKEKR
jgi:hypothetical protein